MIPHPEKAHKGGEDAYVVNDQLLVVLDGVGGWATKGVDPGLMSKELARNIKSLFEQNPHETLKNILVEAVKKQTHTGSSTAVLATFDKDQHNLIRTTNLGDCAYLIYHVSEARDGN